MMEELVDYTSEGFTIPIIKDDTKGYASIHSVMYSEGDGLEPSGSYFIYLLHPTMGSSHFELEPPTGLELAWKILDGPPWVDQTVMMEIVQHIEPRRNGRN
jgi:hypothetical protein